MIPVLHARKDVVVVQRTAPNLGIVLGSGDQSISVGQTVTFPAMAGAGFRLNGETLLLMTTEECTRYTRRNRESAAQQGRRLRPAPVDRVPRLSSQNATSLRPVSDGLSIRHRTWNQ